MDVLRRALWLGLIALGGCAWPPPLPTAAAPNPSEIVDSSANQLPNTAVPPSVAVPSASMPSLSTPRLGGGMLRR
jgi:hypothetical protein